MGEELQGRSVEVRRVEVRCVGVPPAERVARASGVTDVATDGPVLRCTVAGSVQPFLEALQGYEVISLSTATAAVPNHRLTGDPGRHASSGGVMSSHNVNARVAAVLFICATIASLVDRALLSPVLSSPDYLAAIAASSDRVTAGAFFQVIAGLTSAGIAVALYPVLRRSAEGLALGSVGLRFVEGALYIVGAIGALLLVSLSRLVAAGTEAASSASTSGALLLALRDRASMTGVLAFYLGGTLYYVIFFRSRLVPRWLSGWGIAATTLGLTAALLVFFGLTEMFSPLQIALNVPIFFNELVLAGWLLVRGFSSPAASDLVAASGPVTTTSSAVLTERPTYDVSAR
ncbi:MAG TPA: DUF4386 domain-containing protein [Actinotalea sp.]